MKLLFALLLALLTIETSAQTHELVFPVDVVALGQLGTGANKDGWIATELSNYNSTETQFALRFNRNDSRADSPLYSAPVTSVDLSAFSSSSNNLTRQLIVIAHPRLSSSFATNLIYHCAASATTTRPIAQTIVWDPILDIRSFSLAVECKPSAHTSWGVVRLVVHTQKPPGFTLSVR